MCGFGPPNLEKILESFFMSYNLPLFVYRHVHLARIYLQIHEKTVESLAFLFPMVASIVKVLFLQTEMLR
jgi:hypothetical protein